MLMPRLAGRDYPRSYREFAQWYQDDAACAECLEALRWPKGFTCPACRVVGEPWRESRGRLVCRACRHQTTVTAGTILEKTRTPLTIWFEAAWHVTTTKNGFSAKSLERTLGIRYRVAWTMLQRFRVAMVRSERQPWSGIVEVDEALVGGVEHEGKRGRGTKKSIVAIGLEIHPPKGFGRVRMRQVADASDVSLRAFVCETVAPGSVVHTDGWGGYNRLSQSGYVHQRTIMSASDDPAHVAMPGVHRIASLLKRWILAPTKARCPMSIYRRIWRSSPSALTVAPLAAVASFSVGCLSNWSSQIRCPSRGSSMATTGSRTRYSPRRS